MQRETKQSISVLALLFAIFAFAGYGYAATANYTNTSNIYNYSVFNNSGITYNGTYLYNYYNNGTFQSIGYDIIANVLYLEYHNVSFNSTGFEHNNSTIYNNYNNTVIDNINQLNSTITNYYNYTNYDHASLQNISYSASGHTGFESSSHASSTYETISNVTALGLEKLNKSGGNVTGNLSVIGNIVLTKNFEVRNGTDYGILGGFDFYELQSTNQTMARFLSGRGYVKETNTILLGKYGNVSKGYTFQVMSEPVDGTVFEGVRYRYFPVGSITSTQYFFSNEENTIVQLGNFTVTNLSGSGNAYGYLDAAGKFVRDEIDGYASGNVILCFNSTAKMYAC